MGIRTTLDQLQIPYLENDLRDLERWEGKQLHIIHFFRDQSAASYTDVDGCCRFQTCRRGRPCR